MTNSNFISEQIYNERVAQLKAEIAALGMDNVRFGRRIASQSAEIDVRKAEIKRLEAELATARAEFSKECERFHAEGHKCVTCGRKDATEREAETAAILEKAAETSWRPGDAPLTAERVESIKRIRAVIPTDYAAALVERARKARLEEAEWFLATFNDGMTAGKIGELFDRRLAELRATAERGKN